MKQYSGKSAAQSWQGRVNRAQGGYFEDRIKNGCQKYRDQGRANVDKVPEPFHVIKRLSGLQFVGNFVGRAQPDFAGTLIGGRAIRFEAKHTDTGKMDKSEVKDHQAKALAGHYKMGAVTGVCVGIKLQTFFVPWSVWNNMEQIFGRQYVTAQDLRRYEVKFDMKNNAVLFLDFVGLGNSPSGEIAREKETAQRRIKEYESTI